MRKSAIRDDVLLVAYEDLVDAFRKPASRTERTDCLDVLAMLLRERQEDVDYVLQHVINVLEGRAIEITSAERTLDPMTDDGVWPEPRAESDMPFDERLALTKRWIVKAARSGRCRAWILYEHASLGDRVVVRDGAALHYADARWVFGRVKEATERPDDGDMVQLLRAHADRIPTDWEDRSDLIVAYVDLGERAVTGAVELARSITSITSEVAAWATAGPRWLPHGWELLDVDGNWSCYAVHPRASQAAELVDARVQGPRGRRMDAGSGRLRPERAERVRGRARASRCRPEPGARPRCCPSRTCCGAGARIVRQRSRPRLVRRRSGVPRRLDRERDRSRSGAGLSRGGLRVAPRW